MGNKPKNRPINRVNKFFSREDYNLHMDLGREYLEGFLNMSVILYRVDREKTEIGDIYGEVYNEEIRFHPPIEIKCIVDLAAPENMKYNPNGTGRFLEHGNLVFHVYQEFLEELDVEINYGDYILYQETERKNTFWEVSNDGKLYHENEKTVLGYKGFYRTVTCTAVEPDVFKGI
jgi:hypothetical protein